MKNIFSRFSIENIFINIRDTFRTFPLSVFAIIIVASISEYLVFQNRYINGLEIDILSKIIISTSMFYFLSIWIYLYTNRQKFFELKTCLLQAWAIIFSVFFYFSFPDSLTNNFYFENLIYIFISFIWAISLIFISSYINKIKNENFNNNYYSFFNWLYSKIFASVFVWFAMMLMWFVAIWAIFSLFDLRQIFSEWKTFWTWAVISLSFFAPYYFLNQIKQDLTNFWDKIKENKFYNFVNNYLSIPFIIIYFVILYSYTIKVLINFHSWPEGVISWMIIFFSLFWYLIYIFSYVFADKNNLVRIFRKIFPLAVLLQIPMLFYAIYLRINQYDFTINRYLVLVFWIYLLIISLYFLVSKKKYLIFIPAFLTFLIILISVWPWGVYKFPEWRQLSLLTNSLEKAQILVNWEIKLPKTSNDLDKNLSNDIYEKIDYLCSFHSCYSMNPIFTPLFKEIEKEFKSEHTDTRVSYSPYYNEWEITSWELKDRLLKKLKINPYNSVNSIYQNHYISFNLKYNTITNNLVHISWFDYLLDLNNPSFIDINTHYLAQLDTSIARLSIYKDSELYQEYNLSQDFTDIYNLYKDKLTNNNYIELDKAMEIEKIWEKLDVKLILKNFSIPNPDYKWERDSNYINWSILIKQK